MPSLSRRNRQPELMDDPNLDEAEHRRALAGLARINRWSGSAAILWPAICEFAQSHSRPIRVLDLATGSGDVPIDLWQRAKRAGMEIDISACDISPLAIETAKAAAKKRNANVRFFIADVLSDPISERFDIVTCSLFFHHLDEPELISILQKMRDLADSIVLANDLSRGRLNFVLVWLASHLFSRSRIVHVDGALSIRGAFTPVELSALAERAGLNGATVKPRFPCRMLLSWRKP